MTILNLMLGRKRGGLEQAALDYAEALAEAHIPAVTVISPEAWISAPLVTANVAHQSLPNFARYDPLAILRLRALTKTTNASAIICHGNRALALALLALKGRIPIIAVAHNYSTRRFAKADHCFAITHHLAEHLKQSGARTLSHMPNMVRTREAAPRSPFHTPPTIGTMGRLVPKKGFEQLVHALAIVHTRDIPFRAIIGGEGERADAIRKLITGYGLESQIELTGWIKDKTSFFEGIDLFVLPSLHEPFGIVLIEAMSHAVPTITTDAEGPSEIVQDGIDALLTRRNPEAMAEAIIAMLADPTRATALGEAGRNLVMREYTREAMAKRLQIALAPYITIA